MIDHRYQTFLAVSETLSFTAAAQKLGLTQPAVSTHIRSLEEELGVTLINRDKRALNLTYQGEILVKYAKRMQSIEDNLQRKIADSKKGVKSLVIGITHTSESTIAPEILAYYSRQGRGTYIRIVSDSINNLYDMLSSFQIDLAIIEGNNTDDCFCRLLIDTYGPNAEGLARTYGFVLVQKDEDVNEYDTVGIIECPVCHKKYSIYEEYTGWHIPTRISCSEI